ncbi:beta-glucoside-specific PTS transporter subunit IIABC [Lactococcus lactis]|uniref:beta-glucoside-specific PTS transporter subunit IIABC n=1 Tax=Lactococcus lactis TaxID=1358 RepID=UPI00398EB12F
MTKNYEKLAKDIINSLGGSENITEAYHCQTRLRFKVIDEKIINEKEIEDLEGVAKYINNAGVHQVVIGTHVQDVFEEVEKHIPSSRETTSITTKEKKNIINVIIDFVSGTFQPVIPALSGAGMVKAILALLIVFKVITTESQTYYMLNLFADSVFYFLPMLLAFTVAQKLKSNPILAVSIAAMMMHPNWNHLITADHPVHLFGVIPLTLANYTGSVIPILLIIFVQSYIERFLKRIVPKSVELVFVPMLTFLIMGTLAFSILGPIGSILGGYLASFFTFLSINASWVPAVLIGGLLPLMVMFGLHNGIAPLGVMQMASSGYDSIFGPGCLVSNIAQATASLVVALRTKDKKMKQLAFSGSITAYMGITEPTLYGVNLPKKYPLVAAMIGGASGGLYAGLTHSHRFATGSSGLPAILLYIGDNTMKFFWNMIIALIISAVVTGIITYALSFKYETPSVKEKEEVEKTVLKDSVISTPISGEIISLHDVNDEAFASEALGKGFGINPDEGKVFSPFDGKIVALFPTKHAIGLLSDSGAEILIHVGLNTVELNGKFLKSYVSKNQHVKKGQLLLKFDISQIQKAGYSTQVPVILTNTFQYSSINNTKFGFAANGDNVLVAKI